MNRKEAIRQYEQEARLMELGFTHQEAEKIRLVSLTLHRWCERECNGEIERDETTDKPMHFYETASGKRKGYPVPDREKGAIRRLQAILVAHPGLDWYYQTDPRGCSVYIYRHDDVMPGIGVDCSYSTIGLAVY